jgi:Fe-S-cluster containining protein
MGDSPPLGRNSQFSYTCNRCMTCCHDAHLALDPYEIARLARNRHLRTTEFIAHYLTEGGIVLRNREDTACIMLDADGCTVYTDRPQLCRTYPLKRLRGDDHEILLQYARFPASTGVYGKQGTIADFLKRQDVDEFFAAKDRYLDLALQIATVLAQVAKREPGRFATIRDTIDTHCEFRTAVIPSLIDVDRVVSEYCDERQREFPVALDEKITLHIRAIEERLAAISARRHGEETDDPEASRDLLELAAFAGALGAATEIRIVLAFVAGVFGKRESKAT